MDPSRATHAELKASNLNSFNSKKEGLNEVFVMKILLSKTGVE